MSGLQNLVIFFVLDQHTGVLGVVGSAELY